jgi:hypothetical protein
VLISGCLQGYNLEILNFNFFFLLHFNCLRNLEKSLLAVFKNWQPRSINAIINSVGKWLCFPVPGSGNTYPKDMEALLPLMNMVIYSIDKAKKFRLNREVRPKAFILNWHLLCFFPPPRGEQLSVISVIESLLVYLTVPNGSGFMKEC